MPDRKGRKRRPTRDHRPRDAAPARASAPAPRTRPATRRDPAVPSNTARATGFAIAVVTIFLSILTIKEGLDADSSIDVITRVVIGGLLVLVGVVVAALSLFPAQVRRMVRGA